MRRPWIDLHPKVFAALAVAVAVLGLVYLAQLVGIDLAEDAKVWLVGLLPLLAGYLKTGD
jgi:uncharacterized membrane protein HdeD (DUF308 family)